MTETGSSLFRWSFSLLQDMQLLRKLRFKVNVSLHLRYLARMWCVCACVFPCVRLCLVYLPENACVDVRGQHQTLPYLPMTSLCAGSFTGEAVKVP